MYSAISLVSHDAHLLAKSIPTYYDFVDEIVLGLDKDRMTWAGNPFKFDEDKVFSDLKQIDKEDKISIVDDITFYREGVSAIDNDTYERNYLKSQCSGEFIFSFDADEILLNANDFFNKFFPIVEDYVQDRDICMTWATPYKEIKDKTLLICNNDNTPFLKENQGVVTHKSSTYTYARWTDKSASGHNRILSPLTALHYSLCRNESALEMKVKNHGHSDIENDPFLSIWKQVTLQNYQSLRNFKSSGLGGYQWPKLLPVPTDQLETFIEKHILKAYGESQ